MNLRRVWDRATLYLPVLLMGLLALGTWWLVRNAPQPVVQAAPQAPRHEPDYFMQHFAVKSFDAQGQLQSEVHGALARHYPDTDTLEIDQPRVRSTNAQGQRTVATAQRAVSNGDGSEVQLWGNAHITRSQPPAKPGGAEPPPLEFRGEFLHLYRNAERVRSDQPVVLTRGADRFTGDQLEYRHLDRVLELQGRVRGVIHPGPTR